MSHPFLVELRNLLAKHRASIGWTCGAGSDTHGLYEERMTIEVGGKTIAEVDGSDFDASDLPAGPDAPATLSDDGIDSLMDKHGLWNEDRARLRAFARDIEQRRT